MTHFQKGFKYDVKQKLIYYEKKLNSLNTLIEVVIKLNNKFYKLAIKTCYSNPGNKAELYLEYANYYHKRLKTNGHLNDG